jgi:predicted RNase H-like HicB family nuclease
MDAAMKAHSGGYVVRLEQDAETGRWVGSWDKPGGGGVVAEGITIERVMIKFRGALAVFLDDKKAAKAALLMPKLVGVPKPLVTKIEAAVTAKADADERQHRASVAMRKAVAELRLQGFKPRDIGTLLGVTRQWAHKLLKAG